MTDERLHKLGTYFIYFDVLNRYKITFESFTFLVVNDLWEEFRSNRAVLV